VLDEVVGQSDSAGEGVGPDGLGPAVAEMFGQVEEGGEAAGGPGEFGRPAGQVGQVAAVDSEPRLQVTLEVEQRSPAWGSRVSTVGSSLPGVVRLAARAWSSRL
jgi:hypothetical protein